jgi:hypothetical protein
MMDGETLQIGRTRPGNVDAGIAEDRRREDRYGSGMTISILPCASTSKEKWEFLPALVLDVSQHGIGVIANVRVQPGEEFLVKLRIGNVALIQYKVEHCQECSPGRFRIGARLTGCIGTGYSAAVVEILKSE